MTLEEIARGKARWMFPTVSFQAECPECQAALHVVVDFTTPEITFNHMSEGLPCYVPPEPLGDLVSRCCGRLALTCEQMRNAIKEAAKRQLERHGP